jgi:hypothetical protein
MMRTPLEIRKYCERRYTDVLRAIVEGKSLFPIEIRFGKSKRSTDFHALRREVTALAKSGLDFKIEWVEINTRRWGLQRLPARIWFDQEREFVRAIDKEQELQSFRSNLELIRAECPQLEAWLPENIKCLVNEDGSWPSILKVCRYFLRNPKPDLYLRELPISVDTKFVENHSSTIASVLDFLLPKDSALRSTRFEERHGLRFDEPLLRLRFLDNDWKCNRGFPVSDLSVPLTEFNRLALEGSDVFITENKINFLTLPAMKQSIGIFGGGGGVQLLANARWLHRCRLAYWGDIDAHGFFILSRLRLMFPAIRSVMMDEKTLARFRETAVKGPAVRESGPTNLTPEEEHVYKTVSATGLRLEQEKLPFDYAAIELREVKQEFSNGIPAESSA